MTRTISSPTPPARSRPISSTASAPRATILCMSRRRLRACSPASASETPASPPRCRGWPRVARCARPSPSVPISVRRRQARVQWPRLSRIELLRKGGAGGLTGRLFLFGVDLVERRDDRIEGQQGRGVPRLVVAHRLENGGIGPAAGRGRAVLLQHLPH